MATTSIALTPADVEKRVRAVFEVWNTLDPEKIADLYHFSPGFGYRTKPSRDPYPTREAYLKTLLYWLQSIVTYRIVIDELHTQVSGDIGIAWGFYHEEFQERGKAPEVMRGRFSEVHKREANGWRTLFYHREMTPFDERGAYVPPPVR